MSGEHVIRVVGVGGSGCATVEKMTGCAGCDLVAVHTDAMGLLKIRAPTKVLIGKDITGGRSTGNNIRLGEDAAIADRERLSQVLQGAEATFIVAGLGGGTGAGASPVVAESAKNHGSKVIAFVNIPFTAEGSVCKGNATAGLDGLKPYCDLIVVIENDRFLKVVPDLSVRDAFTKVNMILYEAVRGFVNLIVDSGLDNLLPLLSGYATLGHGVGASIKKGVEAAIGSPLVGADTEKATGVLLNIITHAKKIEGLQPALDAVAEATSESASVVWTHTFDDTAEAVEVLALFTGVEPSVLMGDA